MARRTETDAVRRRVAILLAGLALCLGGAAAADVPEIMSYQGVLTLADGSLSDGTYRLQFQIVDDQDQVKFEETLDVEVQGGLYSVLLGGQSGIPLSQVFDDAPRFMDVHVVSGPGIANADLPRQTIVPVPYALHAGRAELPLLEDPVPPGAIILWDQLNGCDDVPHTCPCGWTEAPGFEGMMVRGADTTERFAEIPDDPGVSSGGPGASGTYGDFLTAAQAPEHDHGAASAAGDHSHSLPDYDGYLAGSAYINYKPDQALVDPVSFSGTVTGEGGSHSHVTGWSGGGAAHFHPDRRVLFCRKD